MIKMEEFANRRKQLIKTIGDESIVVLPSAHIMRRNNDTEFPYRQNSDFYYLTGFEEPEAVLVIIPKRKKGQFILFNRKKSPLEETWTGRRAGQLGACKQFLADEAFPIDEFEKKLPELLTDREKLHTTLGADSKFDHLLIRVLNKMRGKIRSGHCTPIAVTDISHTLHEMRLIKSKSEIALMQKAADITVDAHIRAMRYCKPGQFEYQLEAEILHEFHRQGARFEAYPSIVGSGAETCILHYCENKKRIGEKDLVLIDAGCEYQNYAADVTRTFPANGRFTAEQRAIYEIVLAAQLAGIKTIKPGNSWASTQTVMVKIITKGLLELGILKGKLNNLIEQEAYRAFYMHSSGHWLGLDVHDVGRYKTNGKWRTLKPGMVLTVEPGIYIAANNPNVAKRWWNIGIRIEDDVLVTQQGHKVLTERAPKKIDEIEQLMQ